MSQTKLEYVIRPATLRDCREMAITASKTNFKTDLDDFLCPHRADRPDEYIRSYYERITPRFWKPRVLSFVACPTADTESPFAYIQFERIGDVSYTQEQVGPQPGLATTCLIWWLWLKFSVLGYFWHNAAMDKEAMKQFVAWIEIDEERYWKTDDVQNRWHILSLVVEKKWQGRGVGRKLVGEVISRAQRDHLLIGVESSPQGVGMYKKLGFEFVGPFSGKLEKDDVLGGVMVKRFVN